MRLRMNVLLVTPTAPDGVLDPLYSGLSKLSFVRLSEFPFKASFHCGKSQPIEDSFLVTYPCDEVRPSWLRIDVTASTVYQRASDLDIDKFDLIIIGCPWFEQRREISSLLETLHDDAFSRVVVVDGHDDPYLRGIVKMSKLYFKREKIIGILPQKEQINPKNLHKFYFLSRYYRERGQFFVPKFSLPGFNRTLRSINITVIPHEYRGESEKDIDISFVGRYSNSIRYHYVKVLENISKKLGLVSYVNAQGISEKDYINIISRSKIALALPGSGFDTFRYWEIPYYGSCLMSPSLPIHIDNNFKDCVSALFFNNEREFEKKISWALQNDRYEELARNGKKHFEKYHSDIKRAQKVVEEFKEIG